MSDSITALFQRLTQGVYVVGVASGELRNAFTTAWVMQGVVQSLAAGLKHRSASLSYRLLKEGQAFSINVLKKGQLDLAEHFGQPSSTDKLAGQRWTMGRMGLPLLREALAWFECHLVDEHPAGDHMLVLARVIGGKLLDVEAEALSYRETGEMDGSSALFPDVFGD
jgi:flavin reductase (DIM6/NTAB) family NADH-FMN oxidoreductase RutF